MKRKKLKKLGTFDLLTVNELSKIKGGGGTNNDVNPDELLGKGKGSGGSN